MTGNVSPELLGLIDAVCEGTISPTQVVRLEQLLRGNRESQRLYLRKIHLHGALRWGLGSAAEFSVIQRLKESRNSPPQAAGGRREGIRSIWIGLGAAAALLLGMIFVSQATVFTRLAPPAIASTFAVLSQAIDVDWGTGLHPKTGENVSASKLTMRGGLVRIDFRSGASVTLEGPAECELVAGDRIALQSGRLTARVPPSAIGFRVDTPAMRVLDLGTSFGVAVEPTGGAEVFVFEGEIEVSSTKEHAAASQRLLEGEAIRADVGQPELHPVRFEPQRFERSWPMNYGVLRSSGVVRFVRPGPRVAPRRWEDDEHLVVFPERESVLLERALVVSAREPGQYEGPFERQVVGLPAGQNVRSYLLQFNPLGRVKLPVRRLNGSITFDRPIVALIATNEQLAATDGLLGVEGSRPMIGARGIEAGDSFELSADRRTLTMDWTAAAGIDQLRVLVAAIDDSP